MIGFLNNCQNVYLLFYSSFNIGKTISDGIEQFKSFNSSSERFNPQELWMPFKNMLQQLQHVNYRRSVIKLEDVSPALKQLKGTVTCHLYVNQRTRTKTCSFIRHEDPCARRKRGQANGDVVYQLD